MSDSDKQEYLVRRVEHMVARRPRSVHEAKIKLSQIIAKKYPNELKPEHLAQIIINLCISRGLLDDAMFVSWWIGERSYFRPKGRRALYSELSAKGIHKDLIDEYFAQSEFDEAKLARRALIGRKYDSYDPRKWREKITSYLLRRGFLYGTAKKAIEELIESQ